MSEAKYIRTEKFSNRNFTIEIELYEHGLARGDMRCKKRGMRKKMAQDCEWFIAYNYCVGLCAFEYTNFLGCFKGDKVARRWVRRVMRHCVGNFLLPDGRIDFEKAEAEEDRRMHISRKYYKPNCGQLKIMKEHIPDFFYPGTYRTNLENCRRCLQLSSWEGYKHPRTPKPDFTSPPYIRYLRKVAQGLFHAPPKYFPIEDFKRFLEALDPPFYKQVCEEHTMDNCSMALDYTFWKEEGPKMTITVSDKEYDYATLP